MTLTFWWVRSAICLEYFFHEPKKSIVQRQMIKFRILTTQRSGSNWLGSLLNSHPQIRVCGEVFNQSSSNTDPTVTFFNQFQKIHSTRSPGLTFKYIDWFNANFEGTYCSVAFRLMYNHLHKKPEILSKLIWDHYKIIHLIRENHLDALLSYRHAEKTNIYHVKAHVNMAPVHFEPLVLLRKIEDRDKEIKKVIRILTTLPNPVFSITYDKLHNDTQKSLQRSGVVYLLKSKTT